MSASSSHAFNQLDVCRREWRRLVHAEHQLARLATYRYPTKQMRQDKQRWDAEVAEARAELTKLLGTSIKQELNS